MHLAGQQAPKKYGRPYRIGLNLVKENTGGGGGAPARHNYVVDTPGDL